MRTRRTKEDIQAQLAPARAPRRRRPRPPAAPALDQNEIIAAVCKFFCAGHTASEIVDLVREEFGVAISREKPYQLISFAASKGWIRFMAPQAHELREQLEARYRWLARKVDVVHTAVLEDVAAQGARMLLDLIREHHRRHPAKGEVHIGLSGGYSIARLGRFLGEMLRQPNEGLPPKVVFHALVAGSHIEPMAEPNAFFLYLHDVSMPVTTEFVALHAPSVVQSDFIARLKGLEPTKQAYDQAGAIDIFVTSAARWGDPDSVFRRYMSQSKCSKELLEKKHVVGDLLWRPMGPHGPIDDADSEIRTMTLVELPELQRYIAQGKHVLLVVGPCAKCHQPKTEIMRAILNVEPSRQLITHLVTDSRTVAELLSTP